MGLGLPNIASPRQHWRLQEGKNAHPTLYPKCKLNLLQLTYGARRLTDTQTTKNTDWQGKKLTGFDGGKNIKGIKKSITVDTTGFPPNAHFIQINTANTSERKMCKAGFEEVKNDDLGLLKNVQKNI